MDTKALKITGPSSAATVAAIADNPAVVRCCIAWQRAYDEEFANSRSSSFAAYAGAQAYRDSMPILVGFENIRDFIACTAQGILIGSIDERKSTKLLYAAQVALALIGRRPSAREPGAA
jgi:hypothetical protein